MSCKNGTCQGLRHTPHCSLTGGKLTVLLVSVLNAEEMGKDLNDFNKGQIAMASQLNQS